MKGSLPCWKAVIKDIFLLLVGRLSALGSFASRDFRMTNEMVQRAAMAISCLSTPSWLMADLCWLYTASPINVCLRLRKSKLQFLTGQPFCGKSRSIPGRFISIWEWDCTVDAVCGFLSALLSHIVGVRCLSIRMDCSGSASCCSSLAADALSHAKTLIFLAPQSPKSPCLWGLCHPRPSQAQPGDLLPVLWMHHEPATSSVPSQKILLLSFHLCFFITCAGKQHWLASKKATSPALSLIELVFSMIEDYTEFSSFKYANLCWRGRESSVLRD